MTDAVAFPRGGGFPGDGRDDAVTEAGAGTGDGWWARHPTPRFVARRLARVVVSLTVLLVLSFLMIHLIPGDPVRAALGPTASPSLVQERRHQLGLDQPLPTQFADYVRGVVTGDLGTSSIYNLPVSEVVGDRLPNTVRLAGLAFVVILVLALPLGMLAAVLTRDGRRRSTELAFTTGTGSSPRCPSSCSASGWCTCSRSGSAGSRWPARPDRAPTCCRSSR